MWLGSLSKKTRISRWTLIPNSAGFSGDSGVIGSIVIGSFGVLPSADINSHSFISDSPWNGLIFVVGFRCVYLMIHIECWIYGNGSGL